MADGILDKLEDPAIRIAREMSSESFKEVDGVQIIDVLVADNTIVPRFGTSGPDGQFIGEYELQLVFNGRENIDDVRLKTGVSLLHNHRHDGPIYGKTFPGDKGGWRVENGCLFFQAKLGKVAQIAGIVDDVRDGIIDKVSLGFYPRRGTWDFTGPIPRFTADLIQPFEFSVCGVQAIPNALILNHVPSKENPMTTPTNQPAVVVPPAAAAPVAPAVVAAPEVVLAVAPVVAGPAFVVLAENDATISAVMLGAKTLGVYERANARRAVGGSLEQIAEEVGLALRERTVGPAAAAQMLQPQITPSLALPVQKEEPQTLTPAVSAKPWWAEALSERSELRKSIGLVG